MGAKLSLTPGEFDTLDTLAQNEGKPIPFGTDLSHLVKQVGEAGEGFMWIEKHGTTYTFHSRWGHNWKQNAQPPPFAFMPQEVPHPVSWHKKTAKKIFSGTAVFAASVALFILLITASPGQEVIIYDQPVPLAATPPPEENCILTQLGKPPPGMKQTTK